MKAKLLILIASLTVAALCTLSPTSTAAGLSDVNAETEDIINESDAAVAETKDFKQHAAKEKAQATQKRDAANSVLKDSAAKRQKAIDAMHATEAEIARLKEEQAKSKADALRLDGESAQADKIAQDNRAKIEKMKAELVTMKQMRTEKAQKYLEVAGEREKTIANLKTIEEERARADAELQQAKAQEKTASDELTKLKLEYSQKKLKLDAYIASLKERYRHAVDRQAQIASEKTEMERNTLKLEAQAKAGEAEVAQAENPQAPVAVASVAGPAAVDPEAPPPLTPFAEATVPTADGSAERAPAGADLTFKRKCRVFDGPVRGSNVLAVQESGASVAKTNEGKEWVSFLLQDGRKAFAAKNCFR